MNSSTARMDESRWQMPQVAPEPVTAGRFPTLMGGPPAAANPGTIAVSASASAHARPFRMSPHSSSSSHCCGNPALDHLRCAKSRRGLCRRPNTPSANVLPEAGPRTRPPPGSSPPPEEDSPRTKEGTDGGISGGRSGGPSGQGGCRRASENLFVPFSETMILSTERYQYSLAISGRQQAPIAAPGRWSPPPSGPARPPAGRS